VTGPSWRALLAELTSALDGNSEETRLILLDSADLPWSFLAAHLDDPSDPDVAVLAHRRVEQRRSGMPLQWVVGRWGFRTLEVTVDGRALVPRPETEVVVETALDELDRTGTAGDRLVIDLGTGSGVIALSLAVERTPARVVAVDRSAEALALAGENLSALASTVDPTLASRVSLVESDWYAALDPGLRGSVDLVVTNPPYLAEEEWPLLDPVVRDHDPKQALVAGPTGLEALEAVVGGAPEWLRPGGAVVAELAPAQEGAGVRIAEDAGFDDVVVLRDLTGRPRVLRGRLPVSKEIRRRRR
jgi:release factor glutamine methyltransferase